MARDGCGLEPIIVLSNPPEAVLHWSVEGRLESWTAFVDEVARRLGRGCNFYQLLNEPNNPVFKIFPAKSTPTAIISAARVIRQHNPQAKTAVNMLVDLPGWRSDLEKLIREMRQCHRHRWFGLLPADLGCIVRVGVLKLESSGG